MVKALVLFSGGLDSRLVVKILKEQNLKVYLLYFVLPFGCCSDLDSVKEFSKKEKVKIKILDCTKGKLLKEYLDIIKNAKFSRGAGFNPCKDCKIFMLRRARKFSKKIKADLIATGEVLGQRPFSQMKKDFFLIEGEADLKNKILRPLCAKLLEETIYEKKKIINREKLFCISGRNRKKQLELAKEYHLTFPNPSGGCLLCEKILKDRFKFLIKNDLINRNTFYLVNVGRHFLFEKFWVVLGRNKKENEILKKIKKGKLIVPDFPGPSVLVFNTLSKHFIKDSRYLNFQEEKVYDLIKAYSKKGSLKDRKYWEKYKL